MAKTTISMKSYQEPTWDEYTGPELPAGRWYTGEVVRASYRQDKNDIQFIVEVRNEPDFEGWGKGYYAPLDGDSSIFWKTQEMIRALQGGKLTDVTLDWENETQVKAFLKKCKQIKFQTEAYGDEGRISIRKVRPLVSAASTPAAASASNAPATAALPETAKGDDEEALEDYTEEELGELSDEELLEILTEEFEEEAPKKGRRETAEAYTNKLIDAILDAQEGDEEGGTEDQVEAADEDDEDFEDGFAEEAAPEPAPEPVKPARRSRAKAAPEPEPVAEAAPAGRTRRTRR